MIYLDSNVFIYAALGGDKTGNWCRDLIRRVTRGEDEAVTSALAVDEVVYQVRVSRGLEASIQAGEAVPRRGGLAGVHVGVHVCRFGRFGRFGHGNAFPGAPGALRLAFTRSAARISWPSIVTSPAPMVTTTSPGSAACATRCATAEKSGT